MKFVKELIRPALPYKFDRHTELRIDPFGNFIGLSPRVLRAVYEKDEAGNCSTIGLYDVTHSFPHELIEALEK